MNRSDLQIVFNRAVNEAIFEEVADKIDPDHTEGVAPVVIDISISQQDKLIPSLSATTDKDYRRISGKAVGMQGTLVSGVTMNAAVSKIPADSFYPRWFINARIPDTIAGHIYKDDAWKYYIQDIGVNLTDMFYGSPLLSAMLSSGVTSGPISPIYKAYVIMSEAVRGELLKDLQTSPGKNTKTAIEVLKTIHEKYANNANDPQYPDAIPSTVNNVIKNTVNDMLTKNTNKIADAIGNALDPANTLRVNFDQTTINIQSTVGSTQVSGNLTYSNVVRDFIDIPTSTIPVTIFHGFDGDGSLVPDKANSKSQVLTSLEVPSLFLPPVGIQDVTKITTNIADAMRYMDVIDPTNTSNKLYSYKTNDDDSIKPIAIGTIDFANIPYASQTKAIQNFAVDASLLISPVLSSLTRYKLGALTLPIYTSDTAKDTLASIKTTYNITTLTVVGNSNYVGTINGATFDPTKSIYILQDTNALTYNGYYYLTAVEASAISSDFKIARISNLTIDVPTKTLTGVFYKDSAWTQYTKANPAAGILQIETQNIVTDIVITGTTTTTNLVIKTKDATKTLVINTDIRKRIIDTIIKDFQKQDTVPGIMPLDYQVAIIDMHPELIFRTNDKTNIVHEDGCVVFNQRLEHDKEDGIITSGVPFAYIHAPPGSTQSQLISNTTDALNYCRLDDLENITDLVGFADSTETTPLSTSWDNTHLVGKILASIPVKEVTGIKRKYKAFGFQGFITETGSVPVADPLDYSNAAVQVDGDYLSFGVMSASSLDYIPVPYSKLAYSDPNTTFAYAAGRASLVPVSMYGMPADSIMSNRVEVWRSANSESSYYLDSFDLAMNYSYIKMAGYANKNEIMAKCLPFVPCYSEPDEDPEFGIAYEKPIKKAVNPPGLERLEILYCLGNTFIESDNVTVNTGLTETIVRDDILTGPRVDYGIMIDCGKFALPKKMYNSMQRFLATRTYQTNTLVTSLMHVPTSDEIMINPSLDIQSIFTNETLYQLLGSFEFSVYKQFDIDNVLATTIPTDDPAKPDRKKPVLNVNISTVSVNRPDALDRAAIITDMKASGYSEKNIDFNYLYKTAVLSSSDALSSDMTGPLKKCVKLMDYDSQFDNSALILPGMLINKALNEIAPIIETRFWYTGPDGFTARPLGFISAYGMSELYKMNETTIMVKNKVDDGKIMTVNMDRALEAMQLLRSGTLPDLNPVPSTTGIVEMTALDVGRPDIKVNASSLQFAATYRLRTRVAVRPYVYKNTLG